MPESKRLDRAVECPKCGKTVLPFIHHTEEAKPEFDIPRRDVVICPRDECSTLWYLKHEE
jgi:hypothetical protein